MVPDPFFNFGEPAIIACLQPLHVSTAAANLKLRTFPRVIQICCHLCCEHPKRHRALAEPWINIRKGQANRRLDHFGRQEKDSDIGESQYFGKLEMEAWMGVSEIE